MNLAHWASDNTEQPEPHKADAWIDNVPDYHDMTEAYNNIARIKSGIIRVKRDIERVEEQIAVDADRPRSNETRQKRLSATQSLKDMLADLEAEHAVAEAKVKILEYRKSMFASVAYTTKLRFESVGREL